MVDEGVLNECSQHKEVEQVIVTGRRPCGKIHPKLKEIIHTDLYDFSPVENELVNYNDVCY